MAATIAARRYPESFRADVRFTHGPTLALARLAAFDELYRCLKEDQVLRIVSRIGAVDLDPFPRAGQTAWLKRNDVVPRKLQLPRGGNRQAKSNAIAADASEHPVGGKVGVEAIDRSRADAGKRKDQSVELRFSAGLGCIGSQGERASLFIDGAIESSSLGRGRCAQAVHIVTAFGRCREWHRPQGARHSRASAVTAPFFSTLELIARRLRIRPLEVQFVTVQDVRGHSTVTVRPRFEDFSGLFVLHCHIFNHEDVGMMQVIEVYQG